MLAFHLALLLHPQDPLVVWAFASLLYCGEWKLSVGFAKEHANTPLRFSPELKSDADVDLLLEKVTQLASLVKSTVRVFVNPDALAEVNSKFSGSSNQRLVRKVISSAIMQDVDYGLDIILPLSDFQVFVSARMGRAVGEIFNIPRDDLHETNGRKTRDIDYALLKKGNSDEVRFVLGKIIIDTMSSGGMTTQDEKDDRASSSLYSLFR